MDDAALQIILNQIVEPMGQSFSVAAFAYDGNHCVSFWKDHGKLAVFAVGTERVKCASPEKIAVVFSILRRGTGIDPCRIKQLYTVPCAAIQAEKAEAMQLGQRKKQAACTKGISQGIAFPGRAFDAQRSEQTRSKILHQIATGAPLDEYTGQIWSDIIVNKALARRIVKRLSKAEFYPVVFCIERTLIAHQEAAWLTEAHGEQIAHSCALKVFADGLRQVF